MDWLGPKRRGCLGLRDEPIRSHVWFEVLPFNPVYPVACMLPFSV